ncbi:hypothetical protein HYN51_13605 [Limnobaculum parvum]|uniref:Uncharacterized protein n=1 Tax=Limnobaculum parvum TaxID=2172103 RepID=A0A2Y9U0C7_9GAMM|nr:hypothetical protein HYN51_13605 [Limnobaculum parvum]
MVDLFQFGRNGIVCLIMRFKLSEPWIWAVEKRVNELFSLPWSVHGFFAQAKQQSLTVALILAKEF